jgi:thiosulfate dehydrogenase
MRKRTTTIAAMSVVTLVAGGLAMRSRAESPHHSVPRSANGNLVVELCDGETAAEVAGVKEGQTLTRGQAQQVSDQLMAEWRRKHPDAHWDEPIRVAEAKEGGSAAPAEKTPSGSRPETEKQEGHIYGAFTDRDTKIWQRATDEFVAQGKRIFHDAKALGGTIAVSCDMCHPDAANTHPETYPKFQVQFGRVALLRDMINWCIENPVRGKPLHDDDPRLKALEAYILAQRKGTPLEYGKH